jgi:propanol-preferring alcohol dehydrogenase
MSLDVPTHQRAAVLPRADPELRIIVSKEHPVPHPSSLAPDECLVRLTHSGVCHSDLSIRNGHFPPLKSKDLICGHEGIGIVVALGEGHQQDVPLRPGFEDRSLEIKVGTRVGIRFHAKTCLICESCRKGFEARKPPSFRILRGSVNS